jgi:hypothetical protein
MSFDEMADKMAFGPIPVVDARKGKRYHLRNRKVISQMLYSAME